MEKYLNKLHYRSWHRGTKEADLFLGNFFNKYCTKLDESKLMLYEKFLNLANDNDLIVFVKGEKPWAGNLPHEIVELLEEYIISEGFRK